MNKMQNFQKFIWYYLLAMSPLAFTQPAFIDITGATGIEHNYQGYVYGGGVACGDFNNDGYLDLFLPNGAAQQDYLYLNNGDGSFREVAAAAGIGDTLNGVGTACGDIDNDGDLDIYVANYLGENKLYLNDGNARFTETGKAAGVAHPGPGTSVAFVDYNNDRWLDIYVLNQSHASRSVFYRNNGDGTFTDVTMETNTGVTGLSLGVVFFDCDLDGDPDLLVVDEFREDHLFRNNGDGTFTDISAAAEPEEFNSAGMGVDAADIDHDGDFDFLIGDYYLDPLFLNNGAGQFTDVAAQRGIDNTGVGWGVNFMDYDNDGDKDVYIVNGPMVTQSRDEPNVFYTNDGNGFFTRQNESFGTSFTGDGRGSVCADFNRDGYPDIFFVCVLRGKSKLLLNRGGDNNWLVLKLIGTESNRSAVGARVEVKTGILTQVDEVRAGSSYASMHSLELEFGLRKHDVVDRITIYWPSGIKQVLTNVTANQYLTITETPADENNNLPQRITLLQNYPNPFNSETTIQYKLPESGQVNLEIINTAGKIVREFFPGSQPSGEHQVNWKGRDNNGNSVASGIYFYRLKFRTDTGLPAVEVKKMALVK